MAASLRPPGHRADARLLHHVLDAPPQFGAPPQKKILVAAGSPVSPAQDRWHSFVGDLKPGWDGSDYAEPGIAFAGRAERIDRLAEAIAVLEAAFSGERFSFTGQQPRVTTITWTRYGDSGRMGSRSARRRVRGARTAH